MYCSAEDRSITSSCLSLTLSHCQTIRRYWIRAAWVMLSCSLLSYQSPGLEMKPLIRAKNDLHIDNSSYSPVSFGFHRSMSSLLVDGVYPLDPVGRSRILLPSRIFHSLLALVSESVSFCATENALRKWMYIFISLTRRHNAFQWT